ncbi:MAG TPA: NAD(P)H-dependent oxidoreductase subunit E [Pyrinomonadaceae bacterium]|nr:NAD(P)H-dependent oxidoreductase subunit E [Pyrinomonadaceae bacterium]
MSQQFTPNNPLPQEAKVPEEMAVFSPEVEAEIDRHLAKYPVKRSAILPLMFIVQRERDGYLDGPGVAYLADRLGVRITDIWEVATFYSMINTEPVGRYHLQICKTLSCKIMGEPAITEHVCSRLGIKLGETTQDGRFTVSLVECLGSCGTAPVLQLGFDYHENLTTAKVDELIDRCTAGEYQHTVGVKQSA